MIRTFTTIFIVWCICPSFAFRPRKLHRQKIIYRQCARQVHQDAGVTSARRMMQRRRLRYDEHRIELCSDAKRAITDQTKRRRFLRVARKTPTTTVVVTKAPTTTVVAMKRSNGIDIPYSSTIEALRRYHSIHEDLAMPRRFRVPENSGYPEEWVRLDLAASVYSMKWWKKHISTAKTERVSELNRIGFIWERLQPEWNIVLEALVTYHSLHGDVLVTNKFVVPHGYRKWPKATWSIPLGNCVYRIRARNDFLLGANAASRRNQLDSLGFVWDVHEYRFMKFFTVVRHFAKLNNSGTYSIADRPKQLRVPSSFTVPENDDRWPKDLWNFPLGSKCTAVRQKGLYVKNKPKRQRMLEELGFCWSGNADLSWLKVVHAAAIFSKLNNRNLDVPYKFVVPEPPPELAKVCDEWPWPEQLWGLPLGQRLKDIRLNGAYLKGNDKEARHRQLDAIGFIWNVREHRFQTFYAALKHFTKLNHCGKHSKAGHPTPIRVPSAFVVPTNDETWPSELWKYNLGRTTAAVRLQGLYDVKKNAHRRLLLDELGLTLDY